MGRAFHPPLCITWHTFFHMAFVAHHTEVCTGVAEWEGDEPLSEEEEMDRVAASRCKSSTFFWSSVRMARSSLRFWWIGTCQVKKEKAYLDSHNELSSQAMLAPFPSVTEGVQHLWISAYQYLGKVFLESFEMKHFSKLSLSNNTVGGKPIQKTVCTWSWWDTKHIPINVPLSLINTTFSWT